MILIAWKIIENMYRMVCGGSQKNEQREREREGGRGETEREGGGEIKMETAATCRDIKSEDKRERERG